MTCCDRPVAQLHDDRPDGDVTIRGDPENSAFVIGTPVEIDGAQPYEMPYQQVASGWAEYDVSQTVWPDGHITWIIRCHSCKKQAELSDTTLRRFADALAGAEVSQIPLGVACMTLSRLGG